MIFIDMERKKEKKKNLATLERTNEMGPKINDNISGHLRPGRQENKPIRDNKKRRHRKRYHRKRRHRKRHHRKRENGTTENGIIREGNRECHWQETWPHLLITMAASGEVPHVFHWLYYIKQHLCSPHLPSWAIDVSPDKKECLFQAIDMYREAQLNLSLHNDYVHIRLGITGI